MLTEERARAAWSDVIEGRSAVVHRFDRDQRLFLLVRRVAPHERPLGVLERVVVAQVSRGRSNKAIAYELGVSQSTVSGLARSAIARLGAASLIDLVRWPWAV